MNARRKLSLAVPLAAGLLAALLGQPIPARASSHSDAPLIKLDPQANLTDVYAFIRQRPTGQRVLVLEVSVRPFSEPGDGVSYEAFSDDARYSIHIADPTTGAELQRYDFQFSPVGAGGGSYKNIDTILRYGRGANIGGAIDAGAILNVGDAHQNFVQTYTVTRTVGGSSTGLNGGMTLLVPPYNTGPRVTPLYNDTSGTPATNPNYGRAISGATSRAGLDPYTFQTTYDLPGGQTVFAGAREDGFYSDIPGIFDLLDPRILGSTLGQSGNGVDGFKGFNVLHYGIVVPLSDLPAPISYPGIALTPQGGVTVATLSGVGVYASVSRPRVTLRTTTGPAVLSGPYIQVNREANPLFNEALVALRDKDNYNRTSPTGDAAFATYAENPEIARLINAVYGTTFAASGRADLRAIYIPDVIRVDTTTGPIRVSGDPVNPGFNRLSFVGGDVTTNGAGTTVPSGWPNGRRFGDDVIDIALTAVASGPSYSTITVVGDNVADNDQLYNATFPYAGTPHSGTRSSKDSGVNDL
jgi:hypothetical protein